MPRNPSYGCGPDCARLCAIIEQKHVVYPKKNGNLSIKQVTTGEGREMEKLAYSAAVLTHE